MFFAARSWADADFCRGGQNHSGRTFTERVQELRLQRARAMLADFRFDGTKMSDIAFASGFNDLSHFNRCFRRRFGAAPTQFRGNGRGQA